MRTDTKLARPVVEAPDLRIPMPDGAALSARVWMPFDAAARPVPAILEYIPYRKRDGTVQRDALMHPWWAGQGYACLRVDLRGTGESDGLLHDEYTAQELQDACDAIAWIAAQPWCTGRVGMMGKSWGGFNALQTAALAPPALAAVITVCSTSDRFADDIHFKGGCLLGENAGWGAVMLSYSSRPPDPALCPDWRAQWLERLAADLPLAPRWAAHQARDGYWRHGSVCEDWSAIRAPVLAIGGWADNYMNTVFHLVGNLTVPAQGIVGPWGHQYPHTATPGPQIGFLQVALRWWDRWLKDVPNGAEADPALRLWQQDSAPPDASAAERPGRWQCHARWPDPGIRRERLALSAGGVLGGAGGALDLAVATPQHLGLSGGEYFPMARNAECPGDQAADDALAVRFDTPPLAAPLSLTGAARLHLALTSDRPLAFVVARLCDVAPDGRSLRIAHGMLNLCHRDSLAAPAPLTPGEPVAVVLALDHMAHRLAPGHRLRLALSTTCWPFLWPSPEAATLRLHAGHLDLPVQTAAAPGWEPPPPVAAAPWRHRVLAPPAAARRVEHDLIGGGVTLVVEEDAGVTEDLDHGLVAGSAMAERWQIHPGDPLSAQVAIRWTQTLSRGDWSVRTEATTALQATATDLVFRHWLTAWDGETRVFDRDDEQRVPRRFV